MTTKPGGGLALRILASTLVVVLPSTHRLVSMSIKGRQVRYRLPLTHASLCFFKA